MWPRRYGPGDRGPAGSDPFPGKAHDAAAEGLSRASITRLRSGVGVNHQEKTTLLDPQTAIPIDALFATDGVDPNPERDPRQDITGADVILGLEVMSGQQFLLHGRGTLERIARSGKSGRPRCPLIALEKETEELERALALLIVLKGRHDDVAPPGPPVP